MAFVWIRENPPPHGAQLSWLTASDETRLRVGTWAPEGTCRGTVIVLHGRTEFIEKYFEVIGELKGRQFAVATLDWRGQGLSSRALGNPLKGHVASFSEYVRDLTLFMEEVVRAHFPPPYVFLAHSMGGAVALRFAAEAPAVDLTHMVLSAPLTGIVSGSLSEDRQRLMAASACSLGLGRMFVPGRQTNPITEPYESNIVTHDRDRFQRTKAILQAEPQLCLGGPTFQWARAALETARLFQDRAYLARIDIPTLIVSAGNEQLVDNESHARVAEALPHGVQVTIEGARHELLQESKALRTRFWQLFDDFVDLD